MCISGEFSGGGGGGGGEPLKRNPELVLTDVNRELVTIAGALKYGVVIANNAVDIDKTAALRHKISTERPEIQLFERGGTIEEIKARCLQETHLEPLKTPLFHAAGA